MKRITLSALALLLAATGALAQSTGEFVRAIKADNDIAMQNLLARGMDPNTRDERGAPGLYLALQEESMKVAQVLLASPRLQPEARNATDESPLMMAALKGQLDVARRLIALGADVNKPGWTPLHYAASRGQVPMMALLLEEHAFIDAQSPNGTTPLMMAAGFGSPEAVKHLLQAGADTAMRNQKGMSALDFARHYQRPDAVQLLTQARRAQMPAAPRGQW
ncbi:MAG: ankyrin repeat domain-containing protein [Comamonadaceae bacterium]|nr:ankyrin repeat domain-containing protein [Comamonadaceae bacterium]